MTAKEDAKKRALIRHVDRLEMRAAFKRSRAKKAKVCPHGFEYHSPCIVKPVKEKP